MAMPVLCPPLAAGVRLELAANSALINSRMFFYKRYWDMVGPNIISLLVEVYNG